MVNFSGYYVGTASRCDVVQNAMIPHDSLVIRLDCGEGNSAVLEGNESRAFLASDEFKSITDYLVYKDCNPTAAPEICRNEPEEGIDVKKQVIDPLLTKMKEHKKFWEA